MKRYKREARYISVLVVHVPDVMALIDMLRYDRCCPASEDESRKIWSLLGEKRGGGDAKPEDHVIRLLRYSANDMPATDGRWRSFGCRVLDERSPEVEQLSEIDAINLAKVTR